MPTTSGEVLLRRAMDALGSAPRRDNPPKGALLAKGGQVELHRRGPEQGQSWVEVGDYSDSTLAFDEIEDARPQPAPGTLFRVRSKPRGRARPRPVWLGVTHAFEAAARTVLNNGGEAKPTPAEATSSYSISSATTALSIATSVALRRGTREEQDRTMLAWSERFRSWIPLGVVLLARTTSGGGDDGEAPRRTRRA